MRRIRHHAAVRRRGRHRPARRRLDADPAAAGAAAAAVAAAAAAAAADSRAAAAASAAAARREDGMTMPWRRPLSLLAPRRRPITPRVRRAFPADALARIEQAIAAGERDASRPGVLRDRGRAAARARDAAAARRASARSRCSGCCASGTPRRTTACWSICCSPTATSRSSPTAASTRRSATRRGQAICRDDGSGVSRRPLRRGRRGTGVREISALLAPHFPRDRRASATSCPTSRSIL